MTPPKKEAIFLSRSIAEPLLLKRANRILAFGLVLFLFLFAGSFFWGNPPVTERAASSFPSEKPGKNLSPGEDSPQKPYSYYGEDIQKRDIFRPSFTGSAKPAPGVESVKEAAKDLNLVGIVAGKTPHAIIEDKKEGRTLFVNQGDAIGDFRVEAIREDRVILNYQGEQLDLVL